MPTEPARGGTCRSRRRNWSRRSATAGCLAAGASSTSAEAGHETGYLASAGWQATGIDLAGTALAQAAAGHPEAAFLRADARRLPLPPRCLDAAVDRGCFHYLSAADRPRYAGELRRVLRPGGKLLLRASLRTAGVRNDIDEAVIAGTFGAWRVDGMERVEVPSDTRMLEVIVARLAA